MQTMKKIKKEMRMTKIRKKGYSRCILIHVKKKKRNLTEVGHSAINHQLIIHPPHLVLKKKKKKKVFLSKFFF